MLRKDTIQWTLQVISSIINLDFEQKLPEGYSKFTDEFFMHIED